MKEKISAIRVRLLIFPVVMLSLSHAALAGDWIFKNEDKAFGEKTATAIAVGDASVLFVQCDTGELSINLATPEDWEAGSSSMNLLSPKIILATDGAEPVRYESKLGENGLHKLLATVEDEDSVRQATALIVAAKKKIEIGIEIGGKRFHASKISAAGATKKVQAVLNECAPEASSAIGADKKE